MRGAGIGGWRVNRRRRIGSVPVQPDFLLLHARLVVEVDGWAFHSDPQTFENDRRRQNQLVAGGWKVLRFTWGQLQHQPEWVVAQVRALIPTEFCTWMAVQQPLRYKRCSGGGRGAVHQRALPKFRK